MRDTEVLVGFRPSGREAYVLPGTKLVEAAAEAGIVLDAPCGGEGICGKCRLIVVSGAGEPTAAERDRLSAEELAAGWRLACESTVCGPTEIEVPHGSLLATEHQILTHAGDAAPSVDDPPVRKRYVELTPPARGDDLPDALRLERALQADPMSLDLSLLRELPAQLREADFRGTAVLLEGRLLDFEPGNTEADAFALALDIGTTTLVGELLDLGTGSRWAVDARLNPQTRFGDDVLSRILHSHQSPQGLGQLRDSVVQAIDEMISELCRQAGTGRNRIYVMTVAGNTTMQQMLCGIDCAPLGEVPFAPACGRGLECPAVELGIHIHPRGVALIMPVIGGFVGGDTVAGILATGLMPRPTSDDKWDKHSTRDQWGGHSCLPTAGRNACPTDLTDGPTLFVDIGTNGEIVLLANGKLSAASTAAGPAFEGARISRGMRGSAGAIEKVVVDDRLRINVIGNVPPTGLCGSGLIDAAAELLRHGLLTPQGRLLPPDQLPDGILPDLAGRVVMHEKHTAFQLAAASETADGLPILLTQRDFRELQLATGAIRAGIVILLRRAGLEPKDLHSVLIGGGFGNFIRRSNAQRIGLLPAEIEHRRIRYMGNTSLAGARMAALSRRARAVAEELARRTEHVDLSTDADFQRAFADAMIYPEA